MGQGARAVPEEASCCRPLKAQLRTDTDGSLATRDPRGSSGTTSAELSRRLGVPTRCGRSPFAEKVAGIWELGQPAVHRAGAGAVAGEVAAAGMAARRAAVRAGVAEARGGATGGVGAAAAPANLCHRDLYTSHIFVKVEPDGQACFHLIDLQRMLRLWLRRRRWQVQGRGSPGRLGPARPHQPDGSAAVPAGVPGATEAGPPGAAVVA